VDAVLSNLAGLLADVRALVTVWTEAGQQTAAAMRAIAAAVLVMQDGVKEAADAVKAAQASVDGLAQHIEQHGIHINPL
jgi:methyl-accepting chemotaxis protein